MVGGSFSIAYHPIPTSLPSNFIPEPTSPSITSSLERLRLFLKHSVRFKRHLKVPVGTYSYFPRTRSSLKAIDENGQGAGQFLQSNSISVFMRFKKGYTDCNGSSRGSRELQTAVVSYRMNFPWSLLNPFLQVDLVSTIHIADKEYFDSLQKGLERYDCVLYEMMTSRENLKNRRSSLSTKSLKASRFRSFSILGFIQRQMARILALDFQLDCLNYQGDN